MSVVDPVRRQELASFGGFGFGPDDLTADGGDRLLISSRTEGLMEFDTAERTIIRGEGNGIPIPANTGVAVDSEGRVYALESGCSETGLLHILRPDFTEDPDGASGAVRQPGTARPSSSCRGGDYRRHPAVSDLPMPLASTPAIVLSALRYSETSKIVRLATRDPRRAERYRQRGAATQKPVRRGAPDPE